MRTPPSRFLESHVSSQESWVVRERGRETRAHKGPSLAADSPAHPVLRGGRIVRSPPYPTITVNRSATARLAPAPCVIPDARVNIL